MTQEQSAEGTTVDGPSFRRNDEKQRYELLIDGDVVGVATYRDSGPGPGSTRTIIHTIVDSAYEGHGLGTRLVEFALEDLSEQQLHLVPQCPMVAAFIEKHPEWSSLVDDSAVDHVPSGSRTG